MKKNYYFKNFKKFLLLFFVSTAPVLYGQTVTILQPGDAFNDSINNAVPGDIFKFKPGVYGRLNITDVNGTVTQPIVLMREDPDGEVNFQGNYDPDVLWTGKIGGRVWNCSYVAFDKLTFSNGSEGLHVFESDHLIFKDCDVTNTGTVGIKFSKNTANNNSSTDYSHHIDWIGGRIWDTGNTRNGPYGEAIYIGQAQQNLDLTNNIWIEGVEIWDTNGGEAVDIKSEIQHITIKDCNIHDIEVYAVQNVNGMVNQVNSGAIQVGASKNPDKPLDDTPYHQEVWIEGNTVDGVTGKNINTNGSRGNGISIISRPGCYLKNNTIKNVEHDGIYGFDFRAPIPGWTALIDQNTIDNISNIGAGRSPVAIAAGNYVLGANVGNNPMSAQTWYDDFNPNPNPEPEPEPETFPNIESSSGEQEGNPASNVIDGNNGDNNRWSVQNFPKNVVIDYGETKTFMSSKLYTYLNRAYKYRIELSDNPTNGYTTVVDRTGNIDNAQPITDNFAGSGRYVRLTVTGLHNSTSSWVSINELEMVEGIAPPVGNPLTGTFYLKNRNSGKRMTVSAAGKGQLLELGSATGSGNDFEFEISEVPNDQGMYYIKINGFAIRNNDCDTEQGTFVETHDGNGDCTRWEIIENGNFYNLKNKDSGLFARNDDCADEDGNEIELTTGDGGCAQWTLEPVNNSQARMANVPQDIIDVNKKPIFSIYPNPSSERLYINAKEEGQSFNYTLTNMFGQVVRKGKGSSKAIEVNISSLIRGLYILTYEMKGEIIQKKIIIN